MDEDGITTEGTMDGDSSDLHFEEIDYVNPTTTLEGDVFGELGVVILVTFLIGFIFHDFLRVCIAGNRVIVRVVFSLVIITELEAMLLGGVCTLLILPVILLVSFTVVSFQQGVRTISEDP